MVFSLIGSIWLIKPSGGSLQIKLPNQSLQTKDPNSATTLPNEPSEDLENEDENEDDWDAFQSFPTATNANATDIQSNAEKSSMNESHSEEEDDFQEFSSSLPSSDAKENSQPCQNTEKEESTLESCLKNTEYESSERPSEASQSRDSMEISGDINEVNIMTERSTSNDNTSDFQEFSSSLPSSDAEENSQPGQNTENVEPTLESSPKNAEYETTERPSEASQSRDSMEISGDVDEVNIMTEKSTSTHNPSDLTTVQSSEDQEASLLEVSDVFDGNRPLDSSVDSAQNLSSENKDIASPENVNECLELTVSQDNIVTDENSESQTSVENLNIALDQGFIDSSEKIEDQDTATKPETSQNRQDSDKRDSAECESAIQKHEFSTMSGPSETQVQAQAQADTYDSIVKPEEKDKDFKSTSSEVNEDAIAKTEVELLDSSEYDGATKSLEKPRDSTEDNTVEAK